MTGQQIITEKQTMKCHQAMKFGQLIEYNMRNILLEISWTIYGGDASPRLFYWKQYLSTNPETISGNLSQNL